MKKLLLLVLFILFPLIVYPQFWSTETGWEIIYDDTLGLGTKGEWSVNTGTMLLTDTTAEIEMDASSGIATLAAIAYDVQGDGVSNGDMTLGFQIRADYEPGNGTITEYWLPDMNATTGDSTYVGLFQTERIVDGKGCYFDLADVATWVLSDYKRFTIVSQDTVHLILLLKTQ